MLNQGSAPDLRFIESAARMIASIAETNKIVVEKSTVPVKAAESVLDILRSNHKNSVKFQVTEFKLNKLLLNFDINWKIKHSWISADNGYDW